MWFLVTSTGQRLPVPTLPADIGSDGSADVHLPDDSVEPRHARLWAGAETGLRIEACEGALVEIDGWAVLEADLRQGDELLLGGLRVTIERDAQAAHTGPRPLDATPGPLHRAPAGLRPPAAPLMRDTRSGLLHADLGQLAGGTRWLLGLGVLLLAAAVIWAMQALVLALL